MKKINGILFGLILGVANFTLFAEDVTSKECLINGLELSEEVAQFTSTTFDEAEKWQYLEKYFNSNVDTLKLYQKFGKFLKEFSSGISVPVAGIGVILTILVLNSIIDITKPIDDKDSGIVRAFIHKAANSNYVYIPACLVIAPLISHLNSNRLLQSIGKKLENKDGRCNQLLMDFVTNWDKNKAQTPTALQPLFEYLSKDFAANGKFTKIDNAFAQKIVESIVATSLVVNSIE